MPDGGGGLPAYRARDRLAADALHLALMVSRDASPRGNAIRALTEPIDNLMTPLGQGVAPLAAANGEGFFIVCTPPPGPPVSAGLNVWPEKALLDLVLRPIARVLGVLNDRNLTHRAIRPNNVFQSAPGQPVTLGAAWAAPPAMHQPAVFEAPYTALCHPSGRGEGSIAAVDKGRGLRILEHAARASEAHGATLVGANLERSKLSGILAVRADFTDAVLKDAKLVRANLKQASFAGANLAGADLSGADLSGADLTDSVLIGATIYLCNTTNARMEGALTDLSSGIDVTELPWAQMIADHAQWCETSGARGQPSVFDGADLRALKSVKGFNLTALSAKGAVLYGLDMEGVQLQGAHLEGADLRACNLRRADLRGARLMGAKLSGSDLREAQLGPLMISAERVMPSDLTRAIAKGSDFSDADLRHAVMVLSDLNRSNFTGANLKHADLTGAHRVGARGLEALQTPQG